MISFSICVLLIAHCSASTLYFEPLGVEAVICPDGKSQCPDKNTCCKLPTGDYGCCPLPKAVCCSDHLHCCPEGTTCDVSHSKCLQGELSLPWMEKTTAIQLGAVICPDGQSKCPDGSTCCKLTTGQWGCCPLPKAVCCSDHVHCCPNGTKCNLSSGSCDDGKFSMPLLKKTSAIQVGSILCPDGQSQCPEESTCCKLSSGAWGCCPLPKAVCCSDHLHCCPQGTTCDVSHSKCNRGDLSLPWVEKTPASLVPKVGNVICPDGKSQCPDGNTCCALPTGEYGCCPLPNAVCCSDHLHCCPSGTTCDVAHSKCNSGDVSFPWLEKTPAIKAESVVCPDGSQCPDGSTCCELPTGDYGCCPLPNAVCCSDHLHCCPSGTTCDVAHSKCNSGDVSFPWLEKTPAIKAESVVCPDGSQCPDGSTCCVLPTGEYGCCPLPNAVCCSDHLHCCPSGTTCDVAHSKCNSGDVSFPWLEKTPAIKAESVVCPDGSQCPDGSTCCELPTGEYGCCPLPNAVCCSDHLHCCPSGTTCDVAHSKCNSGDVSFPWLEKTPAIKAESVVCPDGSQCPDGSTCCVLPTGEYGCCPLPNAVCCSDHLHCCPSGTTCDVAHSKCNSGDVSFPWLEKTPAIKAESVVCPDGSQCPDGSTCCELPTGEYGCCPLPNAVCCSDHLHCCPGGTTCDVAHSKCNSGDVSFPWLEKTPAIKVNKVILSVDDVVNTVNDIICSKGQTCPDGNTCCPIGEGLFGCCPFPNATCCIDQQHCCPQGFTCDLVQTKCIMGNGVTIPLVKKLPVKTTNENVVCPGGKQQCPSGYTCCLLQSGTYGCCPLPNAVCCSDGQHCCPGGYSCDVSSGKCYKGSVIAIPWVEKVPSLKALVTCPDDRTKCPESNTCCELANKQWACCPIAAATCCEDKIHCCPSYMRCDIPSGKCIRKSLTLPWLEKTPGLTNYVQSITCADGSQCPDGSTCCKLSSGEYGCCPLPSAVCCDDGVHCCPNGYKCNTQQGTCEKADFVSMVTLV